MAEDLPGAAGASDHQVAVGEGREEAEEAEGLPAAAGSGQVVTVVTMVTIIGGIVEVSLWWLRRSILVVCQVSCCFVCARFPFFRCLVKMRNDVATDP